MSRRPLRASLPVVAMFAILVALTVAGLAVVRSLRFTLWPSQVGCAPDRRMEGVPRREIAARLRAGVSDQVDPPPVRLGNFQVNPQWGPLVDQMWVR